MSIIPANYNTHGKSKPSSFHKRSGTSYSTMDFKIKQAREKYQKSPLNFVVTQEFSVLHVLETYCKQYLNIKPFYKTTKIPVVSRLKSDPDSKYTEGKIFIFKISIFGRILGQVETLDKTLSPDLSSLEAIRFLCPSLYQRIISQTSYKNPINEFEIIRNPEQKILNNNNSISNRETDRLTIKESNEQITENSKITHKTAFLNRKNLEIFLNKARQQYLKSSDPENWKPKTLLEKFNLYTTKYIRISFKVLFNIPGVKNEITQFKQDGNEIETFYICPSLKGEGTSTQALLAINFNRFFRAGTDEVKKQLNNKQISFLSIAEGYSKEDAKSKAIQIFLKNSVPELIPNNLKSKNIKKSANPAIPEKKEILEKIESDENYKKLLIDDPLVYTIGPTLTSKKIVHKNPKSLLHELFAKAYSGGMEQRVKFSKTIGGSLGHLVKMEFENIKMEIETEVVKKGENILCQRLMKKLLPTVKTYFELMEICKDNKKLNDLIKSRERGNGGNGKMFSWIEEIKKRNKKLTGKNIKITIMDRERHERKFNLKMLDNISFFK